MGPLLDIMLACAERAILIRCRLARISVLRVASHYWHCVHLHWLSNGARLRGTFDGVRGRPRGYNFPYLKDLDGVVARRFGAVCTPHAFVLNRSRELVY